MLLFATSLSFGFPSFEQVKAQDRPSDLIFLSRDGAKIGSIRTEKHYRKLSWVGLAQIAPLARDILIATEDQRFFDHAGVDWFSLGTNAVRNMAGLKTRGASTLTMQLVSLIDSNQKRRGRRNLSEKLNQIESALSLERTWSKDQILEAYLNLVPLRGEVIGIHAAAELLFHKETLALDPIDASQIVAMLPAPNDSFQKIQSRACAFLKHVYERQAKRAESLCSELQERNFIFQENSALEGEKDLVNESYIYSLFGALGPSQMSKSDVKTTLDLDLQRSVYHFAKETLLNVEAQNVSEIAALVLQNDTGEVLSYLGNVPELSKTPHVDGVLGMRQAGSTLKPFFYERAFLDHKVDLNSELVDEPELFQTSSGAYRPENYDHEFHGRVTIPQALASSLNIPAIQVVEKIGEDIAVEVLKDFGFRSLKPAYLYGSSIALGTVDVNLSELVYAYHRLWKQTQSLTEARIITRILSDSSSRELTFGLNSVLNTHYFTAVKTGTSKDMRDNWCIGFSDRYTVGVWVGNFNGTPMKDVSGVSGAAPLWRKIMDKLHEGRTSKIPDAIASIRLPDLPRAETRASKQSDLTHILYPSDKTVLAYDPEIPTARQKVLFRADGPRAKNEWFLNGKQVAKLSDTFFWPVERGSYTLEVRSLGKEVLDRVWFVVK